MTSIVACGAAAGRSVGGASRDEADPGHPLEVGEAWARELGARLVVEAPGESPIAWQGGRLSKVIAALAAEAGTATR